MNSICKVVWSEAHQQLVVVSELVRSGGKTHSCRSASPRGQTLAVDAWQPKALCLALALGLGAVQAQTATTALPTGGSVSAGQASISQSGANMVINQSSQRAAINWQSFNVGADAQVQFNNGSGTTLNRVTGPEASTIAGRIGATGQVIISNGNGVLFTPGSRIDVGGLVATTHAISDQAFMAGGNLRFERGGSTASVVNEGAITASLQGYVALLAPEVRNSGVIVASKGTVALAAGEAVTLRLNANDQLQGLVVEGGAWQALVENRHVVEAPGGVVILSAKALASVQGGVINNTGTIEATQLSQVNGVVRLEASQAVVHTGTLRAPTIEVQTRNMIDAGLWDASALGNSANSANPGGTIQVNASGSVEQTQSAHMRVDGAQGGSIRIVAQESAYISGTISANGGSTTGGDVSLTAPSLGVAGATISADGQTGGGRIRIGGGLQGRDQDLPNAAKTTVSGSSIQVNATQNGDGGTVVVWSDERTQYASSIQAKGGVAGGDGGRVEISSHGNFQSKGAVDVTAPNGAAGSVLYDPANIEIVSSLSGLTTLSLSDSLAANRYLGNRSITELLNGIPNTTGNSLEGVPTTFGLTAVPNYSGVAALGRVMVASSDDSTVASRAGSIRIFNATTGALISNLTGSNVDDRVGSGVVVNLGDGKYVVTSPLWGGGTAGTAATARGAVTWINGSVGLSGLVSSSNSLVGDQAGDSVGGNINVQVLTNGNYVVRSQRWRGGSTAANALGAVTWGSRSTGITGVVGAGNSLVGRTVGDQVGEDVIALSNGNYLVISTEWDNGAVANVGAVTWANGSTGIKGDIISASNSLIGSSEGDNVGRAPAALMKVVALTNGNYVVSSPYWDKGAVRNVGAVTWGNGSTGTFGVVSVDNSLVGSTANDSIGILGIRALANGNFVVLSPDWANGAASIAGAVTWGNGTTGLTGEVSADNSLVGSAEDDRVGFGVIGLVNGHYVVRSNFWGGSRGATTWADGSTGIKGVVSDINSLVGSTANDGSSLGIVALSNGNYVLASPNWDNGAIANVGAVTWGNGATGTTGVVSSINSLVGSAEGDRVGSGVIGLVNGHYVVRSDHWGSTGQSTSNGKGAVTWGSGTGGTVGQVSAANSLVGLNASDRVGGTGITALTSGHYVVRSEFWGSAGVSNAGWGAVTWGNGTGGTVGAVSAANSLVGSAAGDRVGITGVTGLVNGNYLVRSSFWGSTNLNVATALGAVTWGNGTGGTVGAVSAANSLVGSAAGDRVGITGVTGLVNGNYLVRSEFWGSAGVSNAGWGAVTWGNGTGGTVGPVSATNSLMGALAGDRIGSGNAVTLMDGRALVASPFWQSNSLANVGRVDIVNGASPVSLTPTLAFNNNPDATSYVLTSDLVNLLNAGTAVRLQANNDITVSSSFSTTGTGSLTLNAGRSVLLNASISLNNADLSIIGNEWVTPVNGVGGGVIDAYRASGPAVITQAASTSLSVGTGNLSLILRAAANAGKTNQDTGAITLQSVSAANVSVVNDGSTAGSNVSLGTVNASGNLSAVSNGILDLGTSTVAGNLSATSNNGHIVQAGALTVNGNSNLNAGTGNITLINAGNDFTGAVSATGAVVTINDSNALTLGTVTSSGNLTLTNFGDLNLGTSTVGGDLNATSNNGNISASGVVTVSGVTNLNAGTGSVSVSGPPPAPAPAPSLVLASLTTAAQIQALTSAQIAGLSNAEVQSLTAGQMGFFTPSQMSYFSAAQLQLLTASQVQGLFAAQIAGLNTSQLVSLASLLNPGQIQALSPNQLDSLSSSQLASLVGSMSAVQLQSFSPAQLGGLSAAQVASLVGSLSASQVQLLSVTQLSGLSPSQLASLASSMSAVQLQSLSPAQLGGLSAAQVASLVELLSRAQLQSLTFEQLQQLSFTQVARLAASMTTAQLQALTVSDLTGKLFNQLAQSPTTMGAIDKFNVLHLTSNGDSPIQGVSVILQTSALPNLPTRVMVSLPFGSASTGKGFNFTLPESLRSGAGEAEVFQATLADGTGLPAWLKFDLSKMKLDASAVPMGALPLEIALVQGVQRTLIQIAERAE